MKLLLTSNGLANETICASLEKLTARPRADTRIAFIPTAALAPDPNVDESRDWLARDLHRIGRYAGFLDVVSLADLRPQEVEKRLKAAHVIFVGGGNTFYLSYMFEKAGLFDVLPKLLSDRVYAGISAGSMIATSSVRTASQAITNRTKFYDQRYDELGPQGASSARTAGLVDFAVRPHFNNFSFPQVAGDFLADLATDVACPLYVLDDTSAIVMTGKHIDVVTEGTWRRYNAPMTVAERSRHYTANGLTVEAHHDEAGYTYAPHAHEKTYLSTIAGSVDIKVDQGTWQTLIPGQEFVVGANQLHEAVVGPNGWEYVAGFNADEAAAFGSRQ